MEVVRIVRSLDWTSGWMERRRMLFVRVVWVVSLPVELRIRNTLGDFY
jgi:hypothetical protein